jgi:hypothetical protein
MGFQHAGSLTGAAPIVRRYQGGTDLYVGNLVQTGLVNPAHGGHVEIAESEGEAWENDQMLVGMVSAIADNSRTYVAASSGTAGYGDMSTYTTTQATIAANLGTGLTGGGEVDVTLAIPYDTLIRAPIYNGAWGTALTEQVATSASSTGVTITATGDAIADFTDAFGTIYCRSGANRGHYRVMTTTTSTTVNTVVVPFPYGIVVGDVFVAAGIRLGMSTMNLPSSADCIDGNLVQTSYIPVYYHEINLEESGKEYAIFSTFNNWAAPAT